MKIRNHYCVGGLTLFFLFLTLGDYVLAQSFNFCNDCEGTTGNCAYPAISNNPDLTAECLDLDILFILDESGSIDGFEQDVEDGAMAFLNALNGTGARVAVIEFNETARTVTDYTTVNTALVNNMQGYFNGVNFNGQNYNANSGTNWQDALDQALSLTSSDLLLFFTDGNPTGYTNSSGDTDYCGNGSTTQRPEIVNPMKIANYLKGTENSHMFMMGVGGVTTLNLQRLSGNTEWVDGVNTIANSDYALGDFEDLAESVQQFAFDLCGTELELSISSNTDTVCLGEATTLVYKIKNEGPDNSALNLIVTDTLSASFTNLSCITNCLGVCIGTGCNPDQPALTFRWDVGTLAVGDSAMITLEVTATTTGVFPNTAWAISTNTDPVSADYSIVVNDAAIQEVFAIDATGCGTNDGQLVIDPLVSSGTTMPFTVEYTYNGMVFTAGPFSSSDDNFITGLSPGTYTNITLIDANGCTDVFPGPYTIGGPVGPSVTATASTDICTEDDILFNATGTPGGAAITGYTWSGPNGFGSGIEDPTLASGSGNYPGAGTHIYSVTVTDANGCTAQTTVSVTIFSGPSVMADAGIGMGPGMDGLVSAEGNGPNGFTLVFDESEASFSHEPNRTEKPKTEPSRDKIISSQKHLTTPAAFEGEPFTFLVGGPCQCAHRWEGGAHWNPDGTINDLSNAPPELGIIRCGSSAETENQLQTHSCTYDPNLFEVLLGADCYQPEEGSIPEGRTSIVNAPVNQQDIIWLNFDIRPYAGSFQYQITPGNGTLGWALFYSATSQAGVNPPVSPNPDSLSGDCSQLIYVDCGISATGWATYTVPSFDEPSNYYLAIWRNNNQNFTNQNVTFKGRYGCGDAPDILCLIDTVAVNVNDCTEQGTYAVEVDVQGINGTYVAVDNTNTPGVSFVYNPDPLTLTNLGATPAVIMGTVTAFYPVGIDYNFTIYEDTGTPENSSGNNDINNACQITITGSSAVCCNAQPDSIAVTPESCPDFADGTITVYNPSGGALEYSIDGVNYQTSNVFNGLSAGNYTVYINQIVNTSCADTIFNVNVTNNIPASISASAMDLDICSNLPIELDATGTAGDGAIISYMWSGPFGFTSSQEDPVILTTNPSYPTPGTHTYTVTVTDENGCTATDDVEVTVIEAPTVTVTANNLDICVGGTVTFTANISGGAGGTTNYQWQQFVSGSWTNVGANQNTYTTPPLVSTGSFQFRVIVTQGAVCEVTSAASTVTVVGSPSVSVSASQTNICAGGSALLTATPSGGTGTPHYQWQQFISGSWTNVGTDQNTYSTGLLNTPGSYQYRVILTQNSGCEATSAGTTITVTTDPGVTVTSNDDSICEGGTVTFTANVTGGAGTPHYQWQRLVSGSWTNVGTDQNTYTTPPLLIGSHQFRVVVTQNSGCEVTSSPSTVTVAADPTVTIQAVSSTICTGGMAQLTANVVGGSGTTHYQWQQFIAGSWTNVGSDQNTYTSGPLTNASNDFRVIVNQDAGCNVTSAGITISVVGDPVITVVADDNSICVGGTVTFTANVAGGAGPPHFQWQQFVGGIWTNVGTDQNTYTTNPLNSTGSFEFRVIVTQNSGCETTSATSTVTVVSDPTVTVVADATTICTGGSVLLTANVSGGNGTSHYQWQQLISGVWTNIGTDQSSYLAGPLSNGTIQYRVILTQDAGCQATSAAVTITIGDGPSIDIDADDEDICVGGTVTFTANVTGGSGNESYQWQQLISGIWTNVGADQNTYTSNPLNTIGDHFFRVIVTQNSGCTATSSTMTISVVGDPVVTVQAVESSICTGGSAVINAMVTGGAGASHYQWQQFVGGIWTNVGTDQSSYTSGALTNGTYQYRVIVTQDAGCSTTSAGTTVTVVNDPGVSISTGDMEICEGGSAFLTANVTGGAGTANFQWQQLISGIWTNVGANQNTYTTNPLSLGTHQFRVIVTQNSGCETTSAPISISVVTGPNVTVLADATEICVGGSALLTANVTGGAGTPNYQWQQLISGVWTNVGTNQNTYSTGLLSLGSYQFRVLVTQESGCTATSASTTIAVSNDPTVTVTADDNSICVGGTVTFTAMVNGGAGTSHYQWQQLISGTWTNVGADQNTYTTVPLTNTTTYQFRVIVTQNSGCSTTSTPSSVTVVGDPTVNVQAAEDQICDGGMAMLTAVVSGGTGTSNYQWQQLIGGIWTNVGSNQSTHTSGALATGTHFFRVIVTQDAGCLVQSANTIITVFDDPDVDVNADDLEICAGGTATFTATVTGGAGTPHYQWQFFTGGIWTNVGNDQNTYTTAPLALGMQRFRVIITQNSGCSTTSDEVVVNVVGGPSATVTADANNICVGGSAVLTANVTGGTGTNHYQWQFFSGGSWTNVGTDQNTYTTPTHPLGSYQYRVIVNQDAGCNATSAAITINVVTDPTVTVEADDAEVCVGGIVTFTATVSGGAGTPVYQWQRLISGIWTNVGANSNTYSTPALTLGTHEFRVIVTQNSGCSTTSAPSSVTVVGDPTVELQSDVTNICVGGTATITAVVSGGTGTTHYQWQQLISGVWTDVGTDQSTFTTPTSLAAGSYQYRVIVTQDAGCFVLSGSQTISVSEDPTVGVSATDLSICVGGTVTFFANVSGGTGGVTYQWQQLISGTWTNVGTNMSSYTTNPLNSTGNFQFRVQITQNSGCSATSATVTVTVAGDPTVVLTADDTDVCDGAMATLTATVTGGAGTTTYQWQRLNGGTWVNVGGNQNTYTTPTLFVGFEYIYRVLISQDAGCNVTSDQLEINVFNDPFIELETDGTEVCVGGTATFTANVSLGAGTPHFQWQQLISGVWTNVGSDQNTYTTPPYAATGTFQYRVIVSGNLGCETTSSTIQVNVSNGPSVDVMADANTICSDGMATLTAMVTGGAGTINYQWQAFNGSTWMNVGSNQNTYTTPALSIGTYQYRVVIAQGSGCNATSDSEVITVVGDPTVNVTSNDNDICVGGTVTLTANVSGGAGTTNYQWQQFVSGSWVNVGSNQNTYTPPPFLSVSLNQFRVLITQNSGCSATSATMLIAVNADPTVMVSADANNICVGGSAVLTAMVSGGNGTSNFQWQFLNGAVWTNVGSNSSTYTTPVLNSTGSYLYRVILTQDSGCEATSAATTITVTTDPTVTVTANDDEICTGGTVTLTANVGGGAGTPNYQWQRLVGGTWTNVGTNTSMYTTPALTTGMHEFRVIVTQNSGCSTTSASSTINVVPDPSVTLTAAQNNICIGGQAMLTANVTGGTGTTHYQWQRFLFGSWTNVGTDQNTYNITLNSAGTFQFRVIVTQDAGCQTTSAETTITVTADPTVTISASDADICDGQSTLLTANVSSGAGTSSFQWQQLISGTWTNVGTNQNTYNTGPLSTGNIQFRVTVTQNSGCSTTSGSFTVIVRPNPSANASANQEICNGEAVLISVSPTGGTSPYTYNWSTGATTPSILVAPGTTTTYFVTVTDAFGCASTVDDVVVTVNTNPVANAGLDQTICLTESAMLTASGGVSYSWSNGANTQSTTVTPDMNTTYTVTVTDANGCTDTDDVQVIVNPCIGVISGYVRDNFGNPISNVTIHLYEDPNGNGELDDGLSPAFTTTTEGETGFYIFEDIQPGDYIVVEIQPANYDDVDDYDRSVNASDPDGDDSAQGSDNDIPVTLAPFEGDLDNNFIEDPHVGSISGYVRDDFGNPLQGVTIHLYGDSNLDGNEDGPIFFTATTNSVGFYSFNGIETGFYVVVEVQPADYFSVSDYDHSTGAGDPDGNDQAQGPDEDIPVFVDAGENDMDNNFTENAYPGIICGNVSDNFGSPISNVTLELYADTNGDGNPDGSPLLTITNEGETGDYCFEDVEPGNYVVVEIQPVNYDDVDDYDRSTGAFDPDGDDSAQGADNNIPVTLTAAEADLDNDFVEDGHTGSISGQVREDTGAPIAGVTIQLFGDIDNDGNPDGGVLATTTTNSTGNYLFIPVERGTYVVVETQPAGYESVSDIDGSIGAFDPDGNDGPTPDDNIPVDLAPGENDENNDFVENAFLGLICGNVSDEFGNPISNVTIHLYADTNGDGVEDGPILLTATTEGETGNYCFEDVEHGTYVLVEIQPANYDDISDYDHTTGAFDPDGDDQGQGPDNNIPVVLAAGEADTDNNFIEDGHTGFITGQVREDNGQPIPGVTIQLFGDANEDQIPDGPALFTLLTNTMGNYNFAGIDAGSYLIVETQPAGFSSVSDIDGSITATDMDGNDGPVPDDNIPVILTPGETDADNDFVENAFPGLICGNVSDDAGNPVSNVTLQLFADPEGDGVPNGVPLYTVTNEGETGNYCFEDVPHGLYVIVEIQPLNYDNVSDYDHTTGAFDPDGDDSALGWNNRIPVDLEPAEGDYDNDFIEDPHQGVISGNVRDILNVNIQGVTIQLFGDIDGDGNPDGGVALATTTTNASGNYSFNAVEPGGYVVVETQPTGYASISDIDGSISATDLDGDDGPTPDENIPVVLLPGEIDADNDFVEDAFPGLICGRVIDIYNNPLSNVTINLYHDTDGDGNPDGPVYLTTTSEGETGGYCFEDVPYGNYVIVEIQPDNYDSVSDYDHSTGASDPDGDDSGQGPDDNIPVVLAPGEADVDNDFIEDPNDGVISGQVREDNGQPIQNVSISLHLDANNDGNPDAGPALFTTTTNSAGNYSFNGIIPGSYVVVEVQPANYLSVSDIDGSINANDLDGDDGPTPDDNIPVIILAGEIDADNDFVEDPFQGLICGNVSDNEGNPLSNVVLNLYADTNGDGNPDGSILLTTTTNGETGDYCFEDVEHGTYVIVQVQPPNYDSVSDFDATTGAFDPDGDDSAQGADNNIPVVLLPAEADLDNNFIEDPHTGVISGQVREDSGIPMAGITIRLFVDANNDGLPDGSSVATATTNASGNYIFQPVDQGIYVVVQTHPTNYQSLSDIDGSVNASDPDGDDGPTPDENIPVVLLPGEVDADNDFVEIPFPGLICGNVSDDFGNPISNVQLDLYADTNGDGVQDGSPLYTVTSDGETGNYCFEDVPYGVYVIVQIQPTNYASISDYDHTTIAPDTDGNDSGQGPDNNIPVVLTPGEADMDNNFIEDPFTGVISGQVREDGGVPLSGVTLRLFFDSDGDGNPDGTAVATTTTNGAGNYQFSPVEIGSYVVVETQPANYFSESDIDGSITASDPDGNDGAAPDDNIPVIVEPGEVDADNDFVEIPYPGVICGRVIDDNGNPLSNVLLELYLDANGDGVADAGSPISTALTDGETGQYCFEDIHYGTYVIVEIQPANYNSISDYDHTTAPPDTDGDDSAQGPDNDIPVVLTPGESDLNNDFIEDPNPGAIRGNVAEDIGPVMAGVTIQLYLDNNGDGISDGGVIASTTTNTSGNYVFNGVETGYYVVKQVQPANYFSISDYDHSINATDQDGDDSAQGPDNDIPVFLTPGENDQHNNFREHAYPGLICGTVTNELGNPLSNVILELYVDSNSDGLPDGSPIATATSNGETGVYCFEDIEYGTYVIVQIQPVNFESMSDYDHSTGPSDPDGDDSAQGPDNNIPVVLVPAESDQNNDFIEIACPGLPAVMGDDEYFICDGESVTFNAVTQPVNGAIYTWDFGSTAQPQTATGIGPHTVTYNWTQQNQDEGAQVTMTITKPGCPTQSGEVARVYVSPITDPTILADDFELCAGLQRDFQPAAPLIPGAIYTWNFGAGASPATATGYGPHSVTYSTLGMKTVQLTVNPNYPVLASCPESSEMQFEVVECPGNIGGLVINNAGNPIQGFPIQLFLDTNADGLPDGTSLDNTFSNSSGQFAFINLSPGNYVIMQTQLSGYTSVADMDTDPDFDVVPNLELLDNLIPVTVEPGADDFGNTFVETNNLGSISGTVYEDLDGDNNLDAGEGIAGVKIRLFADTNTDGMPDSATPLDSVVTNSVGNYVFQIVGVGDYVLMEVQPNGFSNGEDIDTSPDGDVVANSDPMDDYIPVSLALTETDADNDFKELGQCTLIVTNTDDSGEGSLRAAIECASEGDTIFFDPSLAGQTILLTSTKLQIEKSITIYCTLVPWVTIDSDISGNIEIMSDNTVKLHNLIVISGPLGNPAAIDNHGELILENVHVRPDPELNMNGNFLMMNDGEVTIMGNTIIFNN